MAIDLLMGDINSDPVHIDQEHLEHSIGLTNMPDGAKTFVSLDALWADPSKQLYINENVSAQGLLDLKRPSDILRLARVAKYVGLYVVDLSHLIELERKYPNSFTTSKVRSVDEETAAKTRPSSISVDGCLILDHLALDMFNDLMVTKYGRDAFLQEISIKPQGNN